MSKLTKNLRKMILMVIIVHIFIVLGYSDSIIILKPNELKKLVSGGYVIVKKENGVDLLHLKTKPLTLSQQQRIDRLKSLGYISGTFEIRGINPIITMPFDLSEINEVILIFTNTRNENFSLRLTINNLKEECLYHKEFPNNDMLKQFENENNAIIFQPNLRHLIEPILVSLEFKSCNMLIKEVQIR